MTVFKIVWGVSIYFAISMVVYIFATKQWPYRPEEDTWDDGDVNKGIAALWPISLPFFAVCGIIFGISKVFDTIRDDITR